MLIPMPEIRLRWTRFLFRITAMLLLLLAGASSQAQQLALQGQWYEAAPDWTYAGQPTLANTGLVPVSQVNKTGGHFFYQADFDIPEAQPRVIDFKNSSVISSFHHWIIDDQGHVMVEAQGGIQSREENPFFLRHARELMLTAGHYRLISEVSSPFFLAQPVPYLDTLTHYRHAIKGGNALTMLCLGVLLGLAFYYAALAVTRRNVTDALYCLFILGNLLYNGTALLVYPDLFGLHWFYLISMPILFSNIAYVFFVLRLLNITPTAHPKLYRIGTLVLALFACFIVLAFCKPNWSLELDRIGVALFMSYGLGAGISRTRQGDVTARNYLIAVVAFFILGIISISLGKLDGAYTFYVEHLGLLAVTVEALLLALVLAGQFALLRLQFEQEHEYATRDALTGLQNRRAFLDTGSAEVERSKRYGHSLAVIFLDLDNFKQLNDSKGHDIGDAALRAIANALLGTLRTHDLVARLGGDEFSILLPEIHYDAAVVTANKISQAVKQALLDYPPVTASIGVAWFGDAHHSFAEMMKAADALMYEAKVGGKDNMLFRRVAAPHEPLRQV
jgi:diguanylate cyclase (GGDEF)-like protein